MLLDKILHPGAPIQEIDLQPRLRGIHAPGDLAGLTQKKSWIFTSVKNWSLSSRIHINNMYIYIHGINHLWDVLTKVTNQLLRYMMV